MNLFCLYHIEQFFLQHDPKRFRLDLSLKNYFKKNSALGSKDRKVLGNFVYKVCRYKSLIDHVLKLKKINTETIQEIAAFEPEKHLVDNSIPLHIRYGFQENFLNLLQKELEPKKFSEFLDSIHHEAPIYARCNPLKISRDALLVELKKLFKVDATHTSPFGLCFEKRENFSALEAFKQGLMEIQDEASQLVAIHLDPKPKENILDFCAGSGGKTLLIAALMQNQGQIFLHDARKNALIEAKKRLKRAGIQNYQIFNPSTSSKKFLNYFDRLLLDVPCSGSGTLRRNPDMKERLGLEDVQRLVQLQREIFSQAFDYAKPKGYILYATCSVLRQENQDQVEFFCQNYPVKKTGSAFQTNPSKGGPDGFFGQLLQVDK
jgi:16S rRNA C967 or C1407 C5-methylase (RsmB/RsmF family)